MADLGTAGFTVISPDEAAKMPLADAIRNAPIEQPKA